MEGISCSAVYLGQENGCQLLGASRQLVGETWLHAAPFHYCGSIGPLELDPVLHGELQNMGEILTSSCGLRGLFGMDFILREGAPWLIEVNPRYTASMEVLEYATTRPLLALHRCVVDQSGSNPGFPPSVNSNHFVGKAILFAHADLTFPKDGPWLKTLIRAFDPWRLPAFADIPHPGEHIRQGRPILTILCQGNTLASCEETLHDMAAEVDRWLFEG